MIEKHALGFDPGVATGFRKRSSPIKEAPSGKRAKPLMLVPLLTLDNG
jgi:hypothetical protein